MATSQMSRANVSNKSNIKIVFPPDKNQIKIKLAKMQLGAVPFIESYMNKLAKELEQYMKKNAVWQDRTGNARRGLSAKVTQSEKKYVTTVTLSHSVEYGKYLEYSMEKRFAIIQPTIDNYAKIAIYATAGIRNDYQQWLRNL